MSSDECVYAPQLLEPIIHRIQSLLNPKKAAQTTLLSKSWHGAYSTRPTIVLDESHFPDDHSSQSDIQDDHSSASDIQIDGLVNYATNTFKRYKESNLRINTFRLSVEKDWYGYSGLATKWTLKALKLGATDLTFRFRTHAIPLQELFGSENIVRLCLKYSVFIGRLKLLHCRGLRSLTLSCVGISPNSILDILSCCPLIENLSLTSLYCNRNRHDGFRRNEVDDDKDEVDDDEYEQPVLQKLTSLVMVFVEYKIQQLLLRDLSSKFPNLKELTLKLCLDPSSSYRAAREIQTISCHSLEILNFGVEEDDCYYYTEQMQRVEFDVPGIRKFTFEGEYTPNLYFTSKMDQWEESHVSLTLTHHYGLSTDWVFELSNFLTKLRLSKIHLCLHLRNRYSHDRENNDQIEGLNAHEVEDLTINNKCLPSLSFNALLDDLFQICRPKMISQYVSPPDDINDDDDISDDDNRYYDDDGDGWNTKNNDKFLCTALEQVMKVKSLLLPTHFKHYLIDLDEVIAEKLYDEVWKPQPFDSILDISTSEQRRFRFQLKWKPK